MSEQALIWHDIFPTTRWLSFRWQIGRTEQGRLYFRVEKRNCDCHGRNHERCKP